MDISKSKLWERVVVEYDKLNTSNPPLNNLLDAFNLCAELTADYGESHDLEHHVCVFRNAVAIFREMNCENDILPFILYIAILHDAVDSKYPENIEYKTARVDAFFMAKLQEKSVDAKWIITNMSYGKENKMGYPVHSNPRIQLARNILSDADKLEAIGDIGILRTNQYSREKNPTASPNEIKRLVIEHCHEKLLRLKDHFIRTEPGKRMAEPLHRILVAYVNSDE